MASSWRTNTLLVLGTALASAGLTAGSLWAEVKRRERYAQRVHRTLVDLLLNALTAGDPVTARHSRRVADLTDALAGSYGFTRAERARLRVASLLHDMGKIDDRFFHIIHSCDPLTEEERRKIEQHPHQSADILRPLERLHPGITRIVESHHECWDGGGYPQGLSGRDIPVGARLISAADVFDALTQPRAYREPLCVDDALAKIRASAGTRFDPEVVARLDLPGVQRSWHEIAERGHEEEDRARERGKKGMAKEMSTESPHGRASA